MKEFKKNIDWQIDFDEFVFKNKDKPFEWGSWDCILFSDAMVKAITGQNLLPKTWKWKTEKEAMQSISKYGNKKGLVHAINSAVKKVKGIEQISVDYAQKGDFVVYKEESELTGIFDGNKVITPSDKGISAKYDANIIACWRINV